MRWEDYALNPEAITRLFDMSPSLTAVRLVAIVFYQNGPRVSLGIELSDFPSHVPERWKRDGVNAVMLGLDLIDVAEVKVIGWSLENVVDVSIDGTPDVRLNIRAIGRGCKFEASCRALHITKVKGYVDERIGPRT